MTMLAREKYSTYGALYDAFEHVFEGGIWDGECLSDGARILRRAGIAAEFVFSLGGVYVLAPDYSDRLTMELFFAHCRNLEIDACDAIEANIPPYYQDQYYELLAEIERELMGGE